MVPPGLGNVRATHYYTTTFAVRHSGTHTYTVRIAKSTPSLRGPASQRRERVTENPDRSKERRFLVLKDDSLNHQTGAWAVRLAKPDPLMFGSSLADVFSAPAYDCRVFGHEQKPQFSVTRLRSGPRGGAAR